MAQNHPQRHSLWSRTRQCAATSHLPGARSHLGAGWGQATLHRPEHLYSSKFSAQVEGTLPAPPLPSHVFPCHHRLRLLPRLGTHCGLPHQA